MAVLKRIWAVILGTCIGGILGIVFDWLKQNGSIPNLVPGTEYAMLYPWVAGGGAFVGSILTILITRDRPQNTKQGKTVQSRKSRATRQKPVKEPVETSPAKGGSEIKSSGLESLKMDHVEGMPGFDFDKSPSTKSSEKQ